MEIWEPQPPGTLCATPGRLRDSFTFIFTQNIYRVFQEEWTKLRESVPYVKLYGYNPKHLRPKLNRYGDKGQRKVWYFRGSTYCTWFA